MWSWVRQASTKLKVKFGAAPIWCWEGYSIWNFPNTVPDPDFPDGLGTVFGIFQILYPSKHHILVQHCAAVVWCCTSMMLGISRWIGYSIWKIPNTVPFPTSYCAAAHWQAWHDTDKHGCTTIFDFCRGRVQYLKISKYCTMVAQLILINPNPSKTSKAHKSPTKKCRNNSTAQNSCARWKL